MRSQCDRELGPLLEHLKSICGGVRESKLRLFDVHMNDSTEALEKIATEGQHQTPTFSSASAWAYKTGDACLGVQVQWCSLHAFFRRLMARTSLLAKSMTSAKMMRDRKVTQAAVELLKALTDSKKSLDTFAEDTFIETYISNFARRFGRGMYFVIWL